MLSHWSQLPKTDCKGLTKLAKEANTCCESMHDYHDCISNNNRACYISSDWCSIEFIKY